MLIGLLLMGLSALTGGGDLDTLDMEIAALEGQRAQLGRHVDNAKRDEVDHKIELLRKVRNRAAAVVQRRVDRCVGAVIQGAQPAARPAAAPSSMPFQPAQSALAAICLHEAQAVVPRVRRAEEIRDRLKYEDWNSGNTDERRGLERELEVLEAGLL